MTVPVRSSYLPNLQPIDPMMTPIIWAVAVSYVLFLGQVAVHNCTHGTLFPRRPKTNQLVGHLICTFTLMSFDGWRHAHILHHRYTNTDKDPHNVDRPLWAYLLTHTYRITRVLWNPRKFAAAMSVPLVVSVLLIAWQYQAGYGFRAAGWICCYWLVPVIAVHLAVAHFNYITHVGLPADRGRNARTLNSGVWKVINKLTFNFYFHWEHHLNPREAKPRLRPDETSTRDDG